MELDELTIVVPTKDEAQNVAVFLRSLPARVDVIAVDDSRDSTPVLLSGLRPLHTLVLRHSGPIAEARQIGADAAHTPWLLFTDADVAFAPGYFRRLEEYRDHDALYGPKLSTDEYTRYYRWFTRGQRLAHGLGIPAATGSNLLVNRRAFEAVGGFDVRLTCNEDSELAWRLKRQGFRIGFAPDLIVYARDHRRLRRGRIRKTIHSLVRCALLYTHLIPARWLSRDWGYWPQRPDRSLGDLSGLEEA